MHILVGIIVGGTAGWLAGQLWKGKGFGCIGNVLVGIIGGVVGNLVFGLLDVSLGRGVLGYLATATIGAVILLAAINVLRRA
ncbi:MAG: GlsB/YeaQ/YmgE family stress response membrane protein [Anaerolineales bacterium]|nr:GlsB/YeaQ/YmgE family stress response membrane protein [Anaerolineales bacterium]